MSVISNTLTIVLELSTYIAVIIMCMGTTQRKGRNEEIVVDAKLSELVPLDREPVRKKHVSTARCQENILDDL